MPEVFPTKGKWTVARTTRWLAIHPDKSQNKISWRDELLFEVVEHLDMKQLISARDLTPQGHSPACLRSPKTRTSTGQWAADRHLLWAFNDWDADGCDAQTMLIMELSQTAPFGNPNDTENCEQAMQIMFLQKTNYSRTVDQNWPTSWLI